jgi:hypothetical protein
VHKYVLSPAACAARRENEGKINRNSENLISE